MSRKFRPLQESIDICTRMILREMNEGYPDRVTGKSYSPDPDAIDYWTRRRNGYAKLASQKGIQVQMTQVEGL